MPNQPKKKKPSKKPRIPPEELPLTGKQIPFVEWYVSAVVNMNGTEAARRAGYKGNDTTLASVAHENLTKPHIRAAIDKRMAIALSGADITIESVLRELSVIGAQSLEDGQYASATRCAELKGKYLKMFTDRIEHAVDVDEMSLEELVLLAKEISEAGGVDISKLLASDGLDDSAGDHIPADQTTH